MFVNRHKGAQNCEKTRLKEGGREGTGQEREKVLVILNKFATN